MPNVKFEAKSPPFEIEDVETELAAELMKFYTGELTGFVRVGPKRYFLPQKYKEQAADIYNVPLRPDDIFVNTYPRSGTTMTQELIWLLHNDLDFEKAKSVPLPYRFPFMEFSILLHPELEKILIEENKHDEEKLKIALASSISAAEKVAKIPSPRFIKTHMPLSLLPPTMLNTVKVVYVARDPRDVAVSHYHLSKLHRIQGAAGDFKTYWNYFIRGLHHWTPLLDHVKEAWEMRHHPNMLFLFYEELNKDRSASVRKVAEFFNKELTEDQVQQLCDHLSFNNFKKNSAVNQVLLGHLDFLNTDAQPFVRQGKVGGWSEYFDDEMKKQAEEWMIEHLKDTDLRYPSFPILE